jgi:hypothetical protein
MDVPKPRHAFRTAWVLVLATVTAAAKTSTRWASRHGLRTVTMAEGPSRRRRQQLLPAFPLGSTWSTVPWSSLGRWVRSPEALESALSRELACGWVAECEAGLGRWRARQAQARKVRGAGRGRQCGWSDDRLWLQAQVYNSCKIESFHHVCLKLEKLHMAFL